MALFRAREIRDGASPDEIRRQVNEAFRAIERDIGAALASPKVTEVITASTYAPGFGEVVRTAPPSGGLALILPEPNLGRVDARITVVQEAASGAMTVEVVNGTINGATTLAYLAGTGTVEFILTPTGWYGWSVSLVNDLPLTALADQLAESFLGNFTAATAPPTARAGSSVAGAGLTYTAGGTLAVGAGTRVTVNANDVQLAEGAAESFLGNFTAGSAVADYRAGSSVAGAGLAYTAGGTLSVGAGTGITANANDVQINEAAALTWTATETFDGQLRLGGEQEDTNTGAINVTLGDVVRLRFSDATGNHTVGTISNPAEGRLLIVEFSGTGTHTTTHSTAANGVSCPANTDLVITGRGGYIAVARTAGGVTNWKVIATTN